MNAADVVVIGGGIIGITAAYYLARAGQRVVLLDKGVIGGEASGRNGGHLSPTIDHAWGPFGQLAYRLWPQLVDELGSATEYVRCGGVRVFMAEDPVDPAHIQRFRQELGFQAELLTPEECRTLIPGLTQDVKAGLFAPMSGQINPIMTMKLLHRAARNAGADIREHCAVTAITVRGGRVQSVSTERGAIDAPFVVNCAGPWASHIGQMVGREVPVVPRRIQILVSEAMPHLYRHNWAGDSLYARQARSGQLHFGAPGPAWESTDWPMDASVTMPTIQRIARHMVDLVPSLANLRVLRSWSGVLAVSPDGAPIVQLCSNPKGFVVATGFGGNGFVTGPAVGRTITDLICTGHTSTDIQHVSLDRFQRDVPA